MTLGNDPQPLTRRQLRELASEQGAADSADEHAPTSTATSTQPRDTSTESSFTELIQKAEAAAKAAAVPRAGERRVSALSDLSDADYLDSLDRTLTRRELRALQAAHEEANESAELSAGATGTTDTEFDSDVVSDVVVAEAVVSEAVAPEAVAPDARPAGAEPTENFDDKADDAPRELHPPVGHWSLDPDDDADVVNEHTHTLDQVQQFDQIIARGIGAGGVPTTTNALILPDMSHQDRPVGSFTSTGEILITGSIDLPRSLGSTGAHPDRFDSSDVDHMLDQIDESGAGSDVAPVSASRAVSSHTSTRGVMTPPKKEIAWLPTVLAITAAALALGVIALFVGAFVFRIF